MTLFSTLSAAPRYIFIISYAESNGSSNLTTKGEERAVALPYYFVETLAPTYGSPQAIFGPREGISGKLVLQTATPTSKLLGEQIHLGFSQENPESLANFILHHKEYDGKTVLIVWDFVSIPSLVAAFGYTPPTVPVPPRFDLTYVLTFPCTPHSPPITLFQTLLLGDSR